MPSFTRKIEDFKCSKCGTFVKGNGYTDHCSSCLSSRHVDINTGDRAANCGAVMEPKSAEYKNGEFTIYYTCLGCGAEKRVHSAKEDNIDALIALTSMPIRYKR